MLLLNAHLPLASLIVFLCFLRTCAVKPHSCVHVRFARQGRSKLVLCIFLLPGSFQISLVTLTCKGSSKNAFVLFPTPWSLEKHFASIFVFVSFSPSQLSIPYMFLIIPFFAFCFPPVICYSLASPTRTFFGREGRTGGDKRDALHITEMCC